MLYFIDFQSTLLELNDTEWNSLQAWAWLFIYHRIVDSEK